MSRGPSWTTKEDEIIRANAHLAGYELAGLIRDRTPQACINRRQELGLNPTKDRPKRKSRSGFSFSGVQARGADAGARARELRPHSIPTLRKFSWEVEQ